MHTSPPKKKSSNLHESQELSGALSKKTEISQNTENFHPCIQRDITLIWKCVWIGIFFYYGKFWKHNKSTFC